MKALFLLLTILLSQASQAATVVGKLQNQQSSWVCIGRTASDVIGSNCANASTYLVLNCVSSGWAGVVCTGRIRFHNTNLCVHAASTSVVQLAACNGSSRQNWRIANSGILSDVYANRYLTLTSSNSITLTGLAASRILTYWQAWFVR